MCVCVYVEKERDRQKTAGAIDRWRARETERPIETETQREMETERGRVFYFKKRTYMIVGAGKSKICRTGWQPGNSKSLM